MLRLSQIRLSLACVAAAAMVALLIIPPPAGAQDDPNEMPLGDVARNLRKKSPPAKSVIDDDNFSNAMDQIENKRARGNSLQFLMGGENKGFLISGPDATCSLSFNAAAKALLSTQYAQMELPPSELSKLEGPAAIEGDALTVSIFNHTAWHVSEVTVALTVVRKTGAAAASDTAANTGGAQTPAYQFSPEEVRPEKRQDTTLIFRMRAAAPPSMTTVFSAPLNLDLVAGEEWHWAIVQARGYPPEGRVEQARTEKEQVDKNSPLNVPWTVPTATGPATQEEPLTPPPVSLAPPQ